MKLRSAAFLGIFLSFHAVPAVAAGKKPTSVVKVGSSPVVSSAGIFIAQEKGYFKEAGLQVELDLFRNSGAPMTVLLAKGDLDVGGGNLTSGLWNAHDQGARIRLVADKGSVLKDASYIALIVRADHVKSGRYKSFKDLKGFNMGLTALQGVSQEIAADRFLRAGGLTLKDVKFHKMSYGEMNVALRNKQLDATIQLEPYVTQAVLDGIAVNAGGAYDVHPGQPSAAIFYSPQFASDRREDAIRFMAAYIRGIRDYNDAFLRGKDRKGIVEILKKYTDVKSDAVWEKMIPVGLNPNGLIDKEALKSDLVWYREQGYSKGAPDVDQVVDHGFAHEALKLLDAQKPH